MTAASTYYFKVTTPMVCTCCSNTIERALSSSVNGIKTMSVSLTSQTVKVDMIQSLCNCLPNEDGTCPCGDACQCTERAIMAAIEAKK